jgi:hypothetical protein
MTDAQPEIAEQQRLDAAKAEQRWLAQAASMRKHARQLVEHAELIENEVARRRGQ